MKEDKNEKSNEKKLTNSEHPLFDKVIEKFEGEIIK